MLTQVSIHASFSEHYDCRAEEHCVDGRLCGHDGKENGHPKTRGSQGARRPGASAGHQLAQQPSGDGDRNSCHSQKKEPRRTRLPGPQS